MSDRTNKSRVITVAVFLLGVFGALGYRLGELHLDPPSLLSRNALEQLRSVQKTITVYRGRICDRGGNPVALDMCLYDLIADPERIMAAEETEKVTEALAEALQKEEHEIARCIDKPGRRFERVGRRLPESRALEIAELDLPGVWSEESITRYYPQEVSMCHVVGFANYNGVGSSGVEQVMDRFLRGCPGFLESRLDGLRRELYDRRVQDIAPKEGADVYLTIDQNVQYVVEKTLHNVIEEHGAAGAWAIVQRVRTGEILAMASQPSYDLNEFRKSSEDQRLNRSIGYVYEPGSTLKIVTVAAALSDGVVTPSTIIDCESGSWLHQGRPLRDHHPYGKLTVADILKKSSNIGAAKIAVEYLGAASLSEHLSRFGVGMKSGIDLPGEEAGLLAELEDWSAISCSRIAIGQGVSVTALQMIGALSAIGNGGVLMRPYVVDRVVAKDGTKLYETKPEQRGSPLDRNTAEIMKRLLARATEDGGTGRRARIDGFAVGGKTGTAQKATRGGYSESDYVASFVGFVPATRPEIAVIVVVDNPQPVHTGGAVAAPAFARIADESTRYLGLHPVRTRRALVASRD